MIRAPLTCTLAFVLLSIRFGMAAEPAPTRHVSYLIVSSRAAQDDAGWKQVAEALLKKHGPDSKIVVYDKQVGEVLSAVRQAAPRHVCFVTQPADAGRQFVADVQPVLTDSFLLVPNPKQCDVNKKYRVVFTAGPG